MRYKKKKGFTIIESLVYIFLTTIILSEGINLYISIYKSYIDDANLSIKYDKCQDFFINLDNIISRGRFEKVMVDNNSITLLKNSDVEDSDKIIKSYNGAIVVKYVDGNVTKTINTIIEDIDNLEVRKKGKLIYLIVRDKEGKEFIKCI
ncbi:hypothetical protein [Clostridium sp. BL-8]|uniref:hypothetical protein n=1 Tax=Clostridium sp. BL-8 TaxID=349938 RepID=UPI00098C7509|nr:hypothetical protein [Clostridium sp. BL-8]OOM80029.1 hypothetical protein CLOBL_10770 [Clostridium sp. BL-8]